MQRNNAQALPILLTPKYEEVIGQLNLARMACHPWIASHTPNFNVGTTNKVSENFMKKYFYSLSVFALFPLNIWAGPISGGGTPDFPYRAVCYVRLVPTELPAYEIFVSFPDAHLQNQTIVNKDPSTNPVAVEQLPIHQIFTQREGVHETYIGQDFSLDIRTDEFLPGGGGNPGSFSGVIEGQELNDLNAECSVFNQANLGS
jgi:hypothetical protein